MPNRPTIPRFPDVVFIAWQRNPLQANSPLTIVQFSVVGSSSPCSNLLQVGRRAIPAARCLLRNGFSISSIRRTTSVSGYVVLVRQ